MISPLAECGANGNIKLCIINGKLKNFVHAALKRITNTVYYIENVFDKLTSSY